MDVWTELVEGLMAYSAEEEWFEFKENWFEPMVLGEYISALSNAAAMAGRKEAYFVWGVRDSDHEVVGMGFPGSATWAVSRSSTGSPVRCSPT